MSKACLHSTEGCITLAFHKHQSAPFPGPHEADVDSLGGATLVLMKAPAEALAVLGIDDTGDFGLDTQDQPEVALSVV